MCGQVGLAEALKRVYFCVVLQGLERVATAACAAAYLVARIAYVPAYYFGLSPWRSAIWFVGFLATFAMIVSTLI